MKFLITESKIRNIIFDYLDKNPLFDDVNEHRYGINRLVYLIRPFYKTEDFGDDIDPDYNLVFIYFKNRQSYEEYHNVMSTYEENSFPLIELDYEYYFKPLSDLFSEKNVKQYVRDWLNSKFKLNAIQLEGN